MSYLYQYQHQCPMNTKYQYRIRIPNTEYFSFLPLLLVVFVSFFLLGCFCFLFNWVLSCISPAPHWHQSFFAIVFLIFYVSTCAHKHHTQPQRQRQTKDQSNSCGSVTFDYAKYSYIRQSVANIIIFGCGHNWPAPLPASLLRTACHPVPPFVLAGAWLALTTANFHNCGTILTQNWPNYVKFV